MNKKKTMTMGQLTMGPTSPGGISGSSTQGKEDVSKPMVSDDFQRPSTLLEREGKSEGKGEGEDKDKNQIILRKTGN